MKIVSIQVGMPKVIEFNGRQVSTGIFKSPVKGSVFVSKLNIAGDGQADLRVHGGVDKAVYAYSLDAYPWWKKTRPNDDFEYGAFGENLTIDEIREDKTYIGDTFSVGEAVLQVAQPRFPCFKLGIKFNDPKILKTFNESKRPGVYFRVLKEGVIDSGQELRLIDREKILFSVQEFFLFGLGEVELEPSRVAELTQLKSLPAKFRDELFQP